jgi:hypothetical protein
MVDWGIIATIGVCIVGGLNSWLLVMARAASEREQVYAAGVDKRFGELRDADHELRDQVQSVNLLVQAQYLTRSEFREGMKDQTALLETLFSRIEQKLDGKADRANRK